MDYIFDFQNVHTCIPIPYCVLFNLFAHKVGFAAKRLQFKRNIIQCLIDFFFILYDAVSSLLIHFGYVLTVSLWIKLELSESVNFKSMSPVSSFDKNLSI